MTVAICLTGCSFTTIEIGLAEKTTPQSITMTFISFKGTKSFTLKCNGEDEILRYSASIETGSADVYYDNGSEKVRMFSVKGGSDVNGSVQNLPKGRIYITIETSEKCTKGQFNIEIDKG